MRRLGSLAYSRHLFAAGAIAALGVGSMFVFCARPRQIEPATGAEGSSALLASDAGPHAAALDPRTRGWDLGRWYAYPLKMTTTVSFGDTKNAFDFDVNGLVQVTPTAVTPESATLYVALSEPAFVSRVAGSQPEFDRIAAQLKSTGCFFTLSGGRVVDMRAPTALSPTAANTYRAIGAALQFAHAAAGDQDYTAEEYDTTGQYEAEYRFDREKSVWHKRKARYLAILGAKTGGANTAVRIVPRVDASDGTVRLLPDGRLATVELQDAITVWGAQQPVHSTTSISLSSGPSEPAHQPGPDWASLMAGMQRIGADEPYGGKATIESLDSARIQGMTFETVLAQFERTAKDKSPPVVSSVNGSQLESDEKDKQEKRTEEESRLFVGLAAILREQPRAVAAAVQRIKGKSQASDILIEALGSASSAAAESALVDLASSKAIDAKARRRVLLSLSRAPRPDPKAIAMLESMLVADPFSEQGLLGLGTFSRRLREAGNVGEAARLGEVFRSRLMEAKEPADQLVVLRAITNSGYAPALSEVSRFLGDKGETIRVAAVRALQSMDDPKVDAMIAERLRTDASSAVRTSALSAAKVREPSDVLAGAVEDAATGAEDPHVRYRAVEVLLGWISQRPDLRATLERVANNDTEDRIRDRAKVAL